MRYFRSTVPVYEQVRLSLDATWGHPNQETKTDTCIQPASNAPRDSSGRVLLATSNEFCDWPAVAELLPQLLNSGLVEEIDASTYQMATPRIR